MPGRAGWSGAGPRDRRGDAGASPSRAQWLIKPKAELHALEDRQASVAIDQVDQTSMVNVDVVAADALGARRHVRHPPGGLLHRQGIGDIDHPEPVGEPGGGNLVADDGFDGLMARRHQGRLDPGQFRQLETADRYRTGLVGDVHHPKRRRQLWREFGIQGLHMLVCDQHPAMAGDRNIDRDQAVRGPAERRTPVEVSDQLRLGHVADVEDDAAAVPVADIQAIAAPDRMVATVVLRLPARCFAAGGPLPLHPPAADLFRPGRVLQVEDHDDGADIALLLGGNVGVAAIEGETVHTHPGALPMADVARIARSADVEDAEADEIISRLLAARTLAVGHHDVIRHPYLMGMQPRRNVDRSDDPWLRRICYVQDRSPVRRLHVPDIGGVAVQDDLAAAGDIDPGDLANAGTLTHGVLPFRISTDERVSPRAAVRAADPCRGEACRPSWSAAPPTTPPDWW